jgi:hypothetical protein
MFLCQACKLSCAFIYSDRTDLIHATEMSWYNRGEICLSLLNVIETAPFTMQEVFFNGSDLFLKVKNENGDKFQIQLITHECHQQTEKSNILCGRFEPNRSIRKLKPVQLQGNISIFHMQDNSLITEANINKRINNIRYSRSKNWRFSTSKLCRQCQGKCSRSCFSLFEGTSDFSCMLKDEVNIHLNTQTTDIFLEPGYTTINNFTDIPGQNTNDHISQVNRLLSKFTSQILSTIAKAVSGRNESALNDEPQGNITETLPQGNTWSNITSQTTSNEKLFDLSKIRYEVSVRNESVLYDQPLGDNIERIIRENNTLSKFTSQTTSNEKLFDVSTIPNKVSVRNESVLNDQLHGDNTESNNWSKFTSQTTSNEKLFDLSTIRYEVSVRNESVLYDQPLGDNIERIPEENNAWSKFTSQTSSSEKLFHLSTILNTLNTMAVFIQAAQMMY